MRGEIDSYRPPPPAVLPVQRRPRVQLQAQPTQAARARPQRPASAGGRSVPCGSRTEPDWPALSLSAHSPYELRRFLRDSHKYLVSVDPKMPFATSQLPPPNAPAF